MLRKNRQLLVILSIFIVFLWANGHQKGASLPLLGAECTSGMLNGDAPEYANPFPIENYSNAYDKLITAKRTIIRLTYVECKLSNC